MTVSAQTPINRSTGNGVTTVFPYDFKILAAADIQVTVDGVAKTLNVDYTVSGVGNEAGGNVTMTVAPANLTSVVRRRNMGLVRTTDYQDQGELPAATLDSDIDAAVLMIQQVNEKTERTLIMPASVVGVSTEVPKPEATKVLAWNADGTGLENVDMIAGQSSLATSLSAPTGASLVGFKQSGAGAVARTAQDKMRESVSVKDFGAVGDGVADDTSKIQAADTYALSINARLVFPNGSYKFTGSSIQSNCFFDGGVLVPSAATLTFSKNVEAGRYQIFTGTSDIVCVNARVIYPEWFGVVPNDGGTTDKESNNKRMMRCVQDSQGHLEFGAGTYYMRDLLVDGSNVEISGQGSATILRNATAYWASSTRFGNFIGAYSPNLNANPSGNLGNRTWTATSQQLNVKFRDFDVLWNDGGVDLMMNGLVIVGYNNVQVTNVNVNLNGANRAFYIGSSYTNQKTENITVRYCKSYNCVTGVFVTEGTDPLATGTIVRHITIENNEFNVTSALANSAGLYHHGTPSTTITAGRINFTNNVVYGGKCGVLTSGPGATSRLQCFLTVEGNYFNSFTEQGVQIFNKSARIANNTFDTTVLAFVSLQLAGILLYSNANGGCQNIDIDGNTFKNLSGTGTIRGIHINCIANTVHNIVNNRFVYENATAPQYDIFYIDGTGVAGDVRLSGNTFYSTGAANVRGTTTNDAYYFIDDGTNVNVYLYNEVTKFMRAVAPTETTRRWRRGEVVGYYSAGTTAGTQIGWVCTATGSPGTWRTIVG